MKIVIIGGGNAGVWTALHYGYYTLNNKNIEVELIHDPEIDSFPVGQSFFPGQSDLLYKACGINWYHNEVIPSFVLLAYGGYKIWIGIKKGKNFTVEQKANSKKTITRFVIGVAIGLYTGIAVMYALSGAEHKRMHDHLEQDKSTVQCPIT